jgi:hypothetical protein
MLRKVFILVVGFATITATAADSRVTSVLLKQPASVMDVGMVVLSNELSGMAYSEFDATGARAYGERFIPHQVFAYYLEEPSGKNIHIVAKYRHADPDLRKEKLDVMCRRMIHWVRFHLGLHDDGSPLTRLDDVNASTMYQFVGSSTTSVEEAGKIAAELDDQTIVIGDIGYVGDGAGWTTMCKDSLRRAEKK